MEHENTTEDWPHLDGSLKSILANRKSPSDLSRTKYKGLFFSLPTNSELKIPREALLKLPTLNHNKKSLKKMKDLMSLT